MSLSLSLQDAGALALVFPVGFLDSKHSLSPPSGIANCMSSIHHQRAAVFTEGTRVTLGVVVLTVRLCISLPQIFSSGTHACSPSEIGSTIPPNELSRHVNLLTLFGREIS